MASTAARRGRKPKSPNPGERASLGLKVTPEIKRKLDLAAQANGRTQSQEAEVRLENSFRDQRLMIDAMILAYGCQVAGIALEIGDLMSEAGRNIGFEVTGTLAGAEDWLSDATVYDEVLKAVVALLEALRPPGEIRPFPRMKAPREMADLQQILDQPRGSGFARGHAALLTGELEIGGAVGEKVAIKRQLLGDELIGRLRSAISAPKRRPR